MIEATPSEVYAPCGDPWTPPTSGRGDSIRAIARACGLSAGHVSRVFRGERRPGDTPAGRKLARILSRRNPAAAK